MLITAETCRQQALALTQAAESSPVTMIRRPLQRRAREWGAAAVCLEEALGSDVDSEPYAEVCLAGALEAGCVIIDHGLHYSLIRVIRDSGGRFAMHVQSESDGRESYINLWGGATSPVVVLR